MNKNVAHTDNLRPRNIRNAFTSLVGQSAGSLADDLQVTNAPTLNQFFLLERLTASGGVTLNVLNCFENVA